MTGRGLGQHAKFIRENMVAMARPGCNGQYVMTASGKVLPDFKFTAEGLAEYKKLSEEVRRPKTLAWISFEKDPAFRDNAIRTYISDCAYPSPPRETLVLRSHTRACEYDAKGEVIRSTKGKDGGSVYAWLTGPARDWLWLSEAEWKSLVPANPRKGMSLPVPRPVTYRICRFYLDDTCQGGHWFWESAKQVRSADLTVTVQEVSDAEIRLRLTGAALLVNGDGNTRLRRCEANFLGYLNYDRDRKAFTRFDVVALGDYDLHESTSQRQRTDITVAKVLGVAFDLATPDTLGFGMPPYALYRGPEWDRTELREHTGPLDLRKFKTYFAAD